MLRRWPRAYARLQKAYYAVLYATETRVLGSKMHEWSWKGRSVGSPAELTASAQHPHRPMLVSRIADRAPFGRVLEVGCNAGTNLLLLARRFPEASFFGVDINPRFIDVGRRWLAAEGIGNVTLSVGCADDLSAFADQSMDVAFTDATLMYVGPDKIKRVIAELRRVTRRALLFNEWHLDRLQAGRPSVWDDFHWVHNFETVLGEVVAHDQVSVTRLPEGLWAPGGGWEEYGALIEVDL